MSGLTFESQGARHLRGEKWLLRKPSDVAPTRLFCFPISGVGASIFHRWPSRIGDIEVCPVQLPGRENRLREKSYETIEQFVSEAAEALVLYFDRPYGLFGHCLGARLAYALTVELEERGYELPNRLYVSSCLAPHRGGCFGPYLPGMDDTQLMSGLLRTARARGLDQPTPELLAMSLQILRTDVQMSFRYKPLGPQHLSTPITTIAWLDDHDVRPEEMDEWRDYGPVRYHVILGDEFRFLTAPSELLAIIEQDFGRSD